MTLLLRDPDAQHAEPAAAPPPEVEPAVRTCPVCQAPLEADQDWCLNCGTAQASRRFALPGKRAAATVLTLSALLVGGAVAASYAALNDNGTPAAAPEQLAQAPAPAPGATPASPAPVEPSPAASSATPAPPPVATTPDAGAAPATPPPAQPSATPSTPASSAPSTQPSSGTTNSNSTSNSATTTHNNSSSSNSQAQTRTTTTPTPAAPAPIKLDESAGALYDPYHRDTAAGDPTKALDGDPGTSFPVTVAADATQIGAGLTVDLGKLRGLRELEVTTKTPGFRIEIYATDSDVLPPDVLDTRWAHLKDVSKVGASQDGKQTISLGSGSTKYRHLMLWFTTPPTEGKTVRVSELKVLG